MCAYNERGNVNVCRQGGCYREQPLIGNSEQILVVSEQGITESCGALVGVRAVKLDNAVANSSRVRIESSEDGFPTERPVVVNIGAMHCEAGPGAHSVGTQRSAVSGLKGESVGERGFEVERTHQVQLSCICKTRFK